MQSTNSLNLLKGGTGTLLATCSMQVAPPRPVTPRVDTPRVSAVMQEQQGQDGQ
jgi:hypothetical protein